MLTVTVDAVDQSDHVKTEVSRRTVKMSLGLGSQWTAAVPMFDTDALTGYRPDTRESFLIEHSVYGTLFNGEIVETPEGPLDQESDQGVLTMVTARAAMAINERIEDVVVTYPAGMTRKQVLQALVDDYLDDFGISLDPAITDGDVLPELTYDGVTPATILNQIQTITGEAWRLTPDLVLEMFIIGSKTAPFSLDGTNAGSVTVQKASSRFVNRARLKAGPTAQIVKDDVVIANGIASSWTLTYTPVSDGAGWILVYPLIYEDDHVNPARQTTLSLPGGGGEFEFDPGTNVLTRTSGVPTAGTTITMQPTVQFPITVMEEDAGSIAAVGLWSKTFSDPTITDLAAAHQVAAGLLATGLQEPRIVTLITTEGFVLPGTTVPLSFPKRLISGDHVVTKVEVADFEDDLVEFTYTLQSGDRAQGTYTDLLRSKLGGGSSGGVTVVGGAGGGSTTVLSSPVRLGGHDLGSYDAPDWIRAQNSAHYFPTASFSGRLRVEIWARDSSVGVTARLYDVTATAVAGSTTSEITSTTRYTQTAVVIPITGGHEYEIQVKATTVPGGKTPKVFLNAAQLEAA